MKSYLNRIPRNLLKTIRQIGKIADRKGVKGYLVGGVVRDIILGCDNLDLDIAVEGNALELGSTAAKEIKARLVKYEQFKTASLYPPSPPWPVGQDRQNFYLGATADVRPYLDRAVGLHPPSHGRIDLATARRESYAHPGALPSVSKGVLKDDLFRRDFTINAMALCINENQLGQLIDPFNGLQDLKKGLIRVLHAQSFMDDPTRILRAVRFEQRFGFTIEKKTLGLLKEALRKNVPQNVKPPRYFAEFKKILKEEEPARYIKRLDKLGVLKFIDSHLKVDYNILRDLPRWGVGAEHWLMYFMAIVQSLPAGVVEKFLEKFHFKREDRQAVLVSLKVKEIILRLSLPKLLPSEVYKILKPLPQVAVFYLYLYSSNKKVSFYIKRFLTKYQNARLAIDGNDLKRLGFNPGQEIGNALEHILYEKMDGKVSSKQEELELAGQLLEVI